MTKLEEFERTTCIACYACKEQNCKNEDELDIRNSGVIKVWCYGINNVHCAVNGECHIQVEMSR